MSTQRVSDNKCPNPNSCCYKNPIDIIYGDRNKEYFDYKLDNRPMSINMFFRDRISEI